MAAPQTFHEKLLQGRIAANQTVDAMAILLNITAEHYEQLESGRYPDDETLRRLCKMMGWNYYEAQRLIINEMISPHHKASGIPARTPEPASARSPTTSGGTDGRASRRPATGSNTRPPTPPR